MKTLAEKMAVMESFQRGERIESMQCLTTNESWIVETEPEWNWVYYDYRVKTKPVERWGYMNQSGEVCESTYPTKAIAEGVFRMAQFGGTLKGRIFLMREVTE